MQGRGGEGEGIGKEGVGRRMWNSQRHEEQQRSIVGHMEKKDMLAKGHVYVEMGAGRGTLSLTLREALPACNIVLVERGSQRYKVDPKMVDRHATASDTLAASGGSNGIDPAAGCAGSFERVRIDIAHLNLRKVAAVQQQKVVVTGKHLCGGATDLALRCAVNTLAPLPPTAPGLAAVELSAAAQPTQDTLGAQGGTLRGIAIATCCHHRCDEQSYLSSAWLHRVFAESSQGGVGVEGGEQLGGGANGGSIAGRGGRVKFDLVRLVTSWACSSLSCTRRPNKDKSIHAQKSRGSVHTSPPLGAAGEGEGLAADGGGVADTGKPFEQGQYLSIVERERVGRECKRLLDFGR